MSAFLEQLFPGCDGIPGKAVTVQKIAADKAKRTVEVSVKLDVFDSAVNAGVGRILARSFEGYKVKTDYNFCSEVFNSDCFFYVLSKMHIAISKSLFSKSGIKVSEDTITLPVATGAKPILNALNFESEFNGVCFKLFGRTFKIDLVEKEITPQENGETPRPEFRERAPAGPKLPRLSDTDMKCRLFELATNEYTLVCGRKPALSSIVKMCDMDKEVGDYTVWGSVFKADMRENRNGGKSYTIGVSDFTSSIYLRQFFPPDASDKAFASIAVGDTLVVSGSYITDKRSFELIMKPRDIIKITRTVRTDCSQEKRIELHLHTRMSAMDAIPSAKDVIERAIQYGQPAVAITDHGVAQSFPEAQSVWEKLQKKGVDFKVIYGMEAYFVNDLNPISVGMDDFKLTEETVVFDVETTGFSPLKERMIEIGAVKIKNGEIGESFCTYVDPEKRVSQRITELTSITNEMLVGAPKEKQALQAFLDFVGDRPLVAHNAKFDISFLTAATRRCNISYKAKYLDTLALSQAVVTGIKNFKLDTLAKALDVQQIHHHTADDDALTLAGIYKKLLQKLEEKGATTGGQLNAGFSGKNYKHQHYRHMILLVKNKVGLKNLYKLVSSGHIDYFYQKPRVPLSELLKHRDGLLIGSACVEGELMQAVVNGESDEKLDEIAKFYDYLEIQPIDNNRFLIEQGMADSEKDLKDFNRRVVKVGERLQKPVVATGDVHYLDSSDAIFRNIIGAGGDEGGSLYFKTTDEMLAEFSYLGKEKAHEVVIDNTHLIADIIDDGIFPIPKGTYAPVIEGAEQRLNDYVRNGLSRLYGENVPQLVRDRTDRELGSIIKNGFSGLYVIARDLVMKSEEDGYHVGSRGSVGSSFVAHLCGITEVNPLPAHYYCKDCKYIEFVPDFSASGFDLPEKECPHCHKKMAGDGQDIPFETFLGFNGEKAPDIDLNFSSEYQQRAHRYTETIFGRENVFKAGTISVIQDKKAYGFVKNYCAEHGINATPAEIDRLSIGCTGIKQTTGQHPGGMVVVPKEYDINDFTPIQHPADASEKGIITTHFDFTPLHDTLLKLDMLGHEVPTMYKYLEDFTGINVNDVPMDDPEVLKMFTSVEPLGITAEDIDSGIGTFGIPEMGTSFVGGLLLESMPSSFADLLQVSGLSHGTDVWLGNAQELIKNGTCTISEVVGTRDGIMLSLIRWGVEKGKAFKIMEFVRKNKKGLPIPDDMIETMHSNSVPEWYIDSLRKIKYMFPKAHAAAYVISAIRLAWFKLYKPVEFYATYFTVRGRDLEISAALGTAEEAKKLLAKQKEALAVGPKGKTKEETSYVALQMLCEMLCRGIKFLPIDLYHSHATKYLIEDGSLRLPFIALKGVGEGAAVSLYEAAQKKRYMSAEELLCEPGVTPSLIEALDGIDALGDLPRSNQVSFF